MYCPTVPQGLVWQRPQSFQLLGKNLKWRRVAKICLCKQDWNLGQCTYTFQEDRRSRKCKCDQMCLCCTPPLFSVVLVRWTIERRNGFVESTLWFWNENLTWGQQLHLSCSLSLSLPLSLSVSLLPSHALFWFLIGHIYGYGKTNLNCS